jgi:ABC-type glycerol-3-phosphate transport system substrate-binding protein
MARHTKMKIAALAATLVATIGMAGISPASSSDSGKTTITHSLRDGGNWCC